MTGPDFRELVGDDVPAEERERLRRVHDLLVIAGPPPELPPALERAPSPAGRVGMLPSRRKGAWIALAAALAAAAFGAGFLVGDRSGGEEQLFQTDFVLNMRGTQAAPGAVARLVVGVKDDDGNWPMLMTVRNLPELPDGGRYELRLTRHGKLGPSCGEFLVRSDKTTAHLNAPFKLRLYDGWVIVRAGSSEVVARTSEI